MKLSVIIPCYNEEAVLETSYRRFSNVLQSAGNDYGQRW